MTTSALHFNPTVVLPISQFHMFKPQAKVNGRCSREFEIGLNRGESKFNIFPMNAVCTGDVSITCVSKDKRVYYSCV